MIPRILSAASSVLTPVVAVSCEQLMDVVVLRGLCSRALTLESRLLYPICRQQEHVMRMRKSLSILAVTEAADCSWPRRIFLDPRGSVVFYEKR